MKKVPVFILMAWLAVFPLAGYPAAKTVELSQNCLGYAYVPRAEAAMKNLSAFAGELNLPSSSIFFIKSALGALLENRQMKGIDWKGPLAVVLLQQGQDNPWAIGVRLSAPKSYYGVLAGSFTLKSEDRKEGTRVYTRQEKVFDTTAYQQASAEEKKKSNQFFRMEEKKLIVARGGDYAWISPNTDLIAALKSYRVPDLKIFPSADFTFLFRADPLLKMARERIEKNMPAIVSAAQSGAKAPAAGIKAYLDLYLDYAQQVKTLAFGLTADQKAVSLEEMVTAESGSGLGEFLRLQKNGKLKLAGYLDPRAWLITDTRVSQPRMLLLPYRKMLQASRSFMAGLVPASRQSDLARFQESALESIESYLDTMGGEMAASISTAPGGIFSYLALQEVKDQKSYRDYLSRRLPATLEKFRKTYQAMGVNYAYTGPETASGREDIYTFKMTFNPVKFPPGEKQGAGAEKLVKKLFSRPITSRLTLRNNIAITATSWGGVNPLPEALARLNGGKKGFDLSLVSPCHRNANGLLYLSLNHYLDFIREIIDQVKTSPPGKEAAALKNLAGIDLPLLICWKVEGETITARTAITLDDIKKVKDALTGVTAPAAAAK